MTWLTWSLVLAAVVVVVLVETHIQRSRRLDSLRASDAWKQVEESILTELAAPGREAAVQHALHQPEANLARLNQLCQVTSAALRAPAAVITVVEFEGQRWLAYYGADWVGEDARAGMLTPLNTSYCQYVVARGEPLAVRDSYRDFRVASATERTRDDIRCYLGAPVRTPDGVTVGSLCVFDTEPRRWSDRDEATIRSYASLVTL